MAGRHVEPVKERFDARIFLLALGTFAIGTNVFVIAGILKQIAAVSTAVPPYGASAAILLGLALFLLGNRRRDRLD